MLDRKQEQENLRDHLGKHLGKATEELVINGDIKAAAQTLGSMNEEECKAAVEHDLHDVCEHFEKNPITPAVDPTDLIGKEKAAPKKEEEKAEPAPTQAANEVPQVVNDLTEEDKMEITTLGLDPKEFPDHKSMEEFRKSGEYEQIMSFMKARSLDIPND
jgi:hypothetical protein